MEFAQAQALKDRVPDQGFTSLSAIERHYLLDWKAAARAAGIDAVEDLSTRAWPHSGADTIIGVFKTGHLLASWLIVAQAGHWAVACCSNGTVTGSLESLPDALAIIFPMEQSLSQS